MKSYYIYTYGCQMNTADSERLSHQLETVGYIPTDDVESADLILLNTCAVRETAETKVFGRIGELKRLKQKNKNLIIAITGCMAQKNQAEMFKRAPHIDIVLGTHNIQHINEMIAEVQRTISIKSMLTWIIQYFQNYRQNLMVHFLLGYRL